MKPEALLINTSRGGVVDTEALLAALDSGRPAAAGLDVFEDEPLPSDHPILGRNDVMVTPHMAAHTTDALYRMAMVAEDVVAVLEGRRPKHPANEVN
jgi:D-3-phosphoglycerate dehydrogenase